MRILLLLFLAASVLFQPCVAAEPAKDPSGWGELTFGMTPKEVVDAMGTGVFLESPGANEVKATPFRTGAGAGEGIDIPAALEFAQNTLSAAEKNKNLDPALVESCRDLRGLLKPRSWSYGPSFDASAQPLERKQPPSKVTATLEQMLNAFNGRVLTVRTAAKNAPLIQFNESRIDQKSKDYVDKVEKAVESLATLCAPKREQPADAGDVVDPSMIHAREVAVRGIKLKPDFTFTDGGLSKVTLSTSFAGDSGANFDHYGIHRTLCAALMDKYGDAKETNDKPTSREMIWRFPKTVVRCVRYELHFPGSSFVRKGVSISYEMPSNENASGDDNL